MTNEAERLIDDLYTQCIYSQCKHDKEARAALLAHIAAKDAEVARLRKLVQTGLAVVKDFMPNIGKCVLQDYGRLNEFLIESSRHD